MFDYLNTPTQQLNSNETVTKTAPYLDLTVPSGSYGVFFNQNIPVKRNTNYVLSCNSTVISGTVTAGQYGARIKWVNDGTYSGINNSSLTFNSGANDYIQVLLYAGLPINNNVTIRFSNIQLEEGSTATAFEAYQLINDIKPTRMKPKKNYINWGSPTESGIDYAIASGTRVINSGYDTYKIDYVKPNTTYTYSGTTNTHLNYYDYSGNWIMGDWANTNPKTLTTPSNAYSIRVSVEKASVSGNSVQMEQGSVATAFEPYTLIPDVKLALR